MLEVEHSSTTFGAATLIPGFPLNVHVPAPNRTVAGLLRFSVASHVCPGLNPRASIVPPAAGSAPIAALIFAHGSDCGNIAGFGTPFVVCTVKAVKFPLFGVTSPIGGGEDQFPPPPPEFASTYALFAASFAFCGVGTTGELLNVFTP